MNIPAIYAPVFRLKHDKAQDVRALAKAILDIGGGRPMLPEATLRRYGVRREEPEGESCCDREQRARIDTIRDLVLPHDYTCPGCQRVWTIAMEMS